MRKTIIRLLLAIAYDIFKGSVNPNPADQVTPLSKPLMDLPALLRAPRFPGDDEKTRVASVLHAVLLMLGSMTLLGLCVGVPIFFTAKVFNAVLFGCLGVAILAAWRWLHRGKVRSASILLLVQLHSIVFLTVLANGGIHSASLVVLAVPGILGVLVLGFRWGLVSTALCFLVLSVFAALGGAGVEVPRWMPGDPLGVWFVNALILWFLFLATRLSLDGWDRSIASTREAFLERCRLEDETSVLKEALLDAERMESLGRMAGGVAHDLNNLMMVFKERLRQVEESYPEDARLREDLGRVEGSLERIRDLHRGLLEYCKGREPQLQRFELDPYLQEAVPILQSLLPEGVFLEWVPGAPGAVIQADKSFLVQVLHALMLNAREGLPAGGLVTLRTRYLEVEKASPDLPVGRYVQFGVRDNGKGMDLAARGRLFDLSFTLRKGGEGFALPMVLDLVRRQGGTIQVDSAPGEGTEFKILFPLAGGAP